MNSRKKGTLIIKGPLGNLVVVTRPLGVLHVALDPQTQNPQKPEILKLLNP